MSHQVASSSQNVGGVAGGLKFLAHGIFFKFALDEHNIYGNIENAMKAARHELNGIKAYRNLNLPGLHFPMFLLIDYKGYRIISTTLLPLGKNTLVYGSGDAAKTVFASDPEMNKLMEVAGNALFLKPHRVGTFRTVLYAPVDIEGHRGTDGRLYLLDTARVNPPVFLITTTLVSNER